MAGETACAILAGIDRLVPDLEEIYRDLHTHPELSMRETRTAAEVARRLADAGLEVTTGVGGTGVVGVLRGDEGPVVLLRADMDALPVAERTGLPYASEAVAADPGGRQVPVMHACGHDMHMACLLGAVTLLARHRDRWRGTLVAVFQPAEETAAGAQAMIDDGMLDRFPRPDVVLGQHVGPRPVGALDIRAGVAMAAADSLRIRLIGRGSHGSQPESSIDPVVMAAAAVLRLQTIVSREVAPKDRAVVTVGSIEAGTKENIIPGEAELKVNVRTFEPTVRSRVLAAIERVVRAEAEASGAIRPPEFSTIHSFPLTYNDPEAAARLSVAFGDVFGHDRVHELEPKAGSEDFGRFGTEAGAPSVFWFFGGGDPDAYAAAQAAGRLAEDVPTNHSPYFAPLIQPTLREGVRALVVAACAWLGVR
ncbi:MAG: amidohydrolase [Streptosporangiaceae bacterium]